MSIYVPPHLINTTIDTSKLKRQEFTEEGNTIIITNSPYKPLESFSSIIRAHNLNFKNPTPIQKYVIPILLNKQPVRVRAPTGSGKTLAFLLPLIENIRYAGTGIKICIITPVRELAMQIKEEAKKMIIKNEIRVNTMYGGTKYEEANSLTDILIATPGKLQKFLENKSISLKSAEYLVLDEADRLLDMGFEKAILEIKSYTSEKIKVCLFSATYQNNLDKIIKSLLPADNFYVEVQKETLVNIKQTFINAKYNQKNEILKDILSKMDFKKNWREKKFGDKVIIFVEKKSDTEILKKKLIEFKFNCETIHGNKQQMEREAILKDFRACSSSILIATSVASRGIDIKDVNLVINYDFPNDLKDYIHRIGRTGREGKKGEAISFINMSNMDEKMREEIVKILKESDNKVPEFLLKKVIRESRFGNSSLNKNISKLNIKNENNVVEKSMASDLLINEKNDSDDEMPGQW